ncbi:DUF4167 domain-containing protein [Maricaulis sp.]|jgi:hypothetical protein|uniref:DUF4167 domain-containing protein n=1 Tax=Maricaulis sp. TaxID=1486257 RepID=UPI002617DAF0|nr:DUF4167 domain-containing protein [Maricaulis sp.]
MKRQRGRGRKSGNPANRSYESNGPEVKIRGNASQIYDKYLQLARDASSAGDRVRAENLYQHAEHYFRIIQANQPKRDPNQDDSDNAEASGDDEDYDQSSDDNQSPGNSGQSRNRRGRGRQRQQPQQQSGQDDPLGVVTPEGEASSANGEDKSDSSGDSEDDAPRRRTRRPRRTKAEIAADKAAAEAALENAGSGSDDGDRTGGGDDSTSEAA